MKKILVIQQKMIGDVLLSTILCEWLKKRYPDAQIHYCIYDHTYPVVSHNPFIDRVILYKSEYRKNKKALWQFLKSIKGEHFDMVVDAYGKLESGLITWFSGAPERISYKKGYTKFIYTKTIKRSSIVYTNAGNAVEDRLRLLIPEEEIKNNILKPKIYLTQEERAKAQKMLQEKGIDFNRPIIMIGILGSSQDKSLPADYMALLIEEVAEKSQGQLLFNFMPSQQEEAETIFDLLSEQAKAQSFFDIYGTGLRDFLMLLCHCNMLIGNEGGAVNMAKALEVPTFTIFSPWIHKKAWNLFEDGHNNLSVHLSDFEPELYETKSMKEIKKMAQNYYQRLKPDYWRPALLKFIANHTGPK